MASPYGHLGDPSLAPIDRVWTLQELDILQELPTPIVILLYEINRFVLCVLATCAKCSFPHHKPLPVLCRGVTQHSCQLLFENVSFLRRFGLPRSQVEYSNVWNRLSDAEQAAKWSSITTILQVLISATQA